MEDQSRTPPFNKHKRYYLFIKIAVIVLAVAMAIRYFVIG